MKVQRNYQAKPRPSIICPRGTPVVSSSLRSGFTLAEMAVTVAITGVVMVGLGSVVLLASKVLPNTASASSELIQSSMTADDIVTELQHACHIFERTANAVTFTVADYDNDSDHSPELIRYAWSGTPGDTLTRQHNNGTEITVLENVQEFNLTYELESITEQYPGPDVEGAEVELMSYYSASQSEAHVHDNQWWAQYFKPTLPAEATSWSVKRVVFSAKRDHNDDTTTLIQLHLPAADNTPGDTIIDTASMTLLSLPTDYQWIQKLFSNATGLSPSEGLCLAFITYGNNSCRLLYTNGGVSLPNAALIEGSPAWNTPVTDEALLFYIYGTYSVPGPDQIAVRQYVTGMRIVLQTGDDTSTRINTAIRLLNDPEVLSAVWEMEFDTDPTAYDMNGDLLDDWVTQDGTPFNPASISGGIWYADAALNTYPENSFTELTTAEVRFRNTSIGGNGAVFWINADWSGSSFAMIYASLQLQADNTQKLIVTTRRSMAVEDILLTVPDLSTDFITLRLLIDPSLNTVNVKVDGDDKGTYNYHTFTPFNTDRFATVRPWGSSAEFDYVSIKVGGTSP
ncbi:MAG: type II secretion system protein [Planctomycetota bacterium]